VTTVARLWQGRAGAREEMTHEEQMLRTATLILLAFGAVMVYSASSGTSLLSHDGDSSQYLKRYLVSAGLGLLALRFFARNGLRVAQEATPIVMAVAFAGLLLVLMPGFGIEANGSRRWLGAGPVQVQPSEIAKLALVLYSAMLLASQPQRARSLYGVRPILLVAGAMALLIVVQPDLGTTLVIMFSVFALLAVGGVSLRHLAVLAGILVALALVAALLEPYRRERLTSFINPWSDPEGSGFQSVQAMIAIGSGGFFGVGLGESVQKLFYLPEAHTDMILAVIGEELGFAGIGVVLFLYGMIAYAGLRAARRARDHYAKLLAAGITSVILIQAVVNFFAVLGLLPLTGVPLPFISYGNSNLIVLLSGMGILINVAHEGGARARKPKLKVIEGTAGRASSPRAIRPTDAKSRDSGRRDRRARGAGAGRRRRAAG
jgi:cell division protein FtsW